MSAYSTPGVYLQAVTVTPPPPLQTGVPAFLGYTTSGQANVPQLLTHWTQFAGLFGAPLATSYLAYAVRGFFENGGLFCYVVPLQTGAATTALSQGLQAIANMETLDLVCAPDIMQQPAAAQHALQQQVLDHCATLDNRFAILDTAAAADMLAQVGPGVQGINGALYFPWVLTNNWTPGQPAVWVPPCGHIAGLYAQCDGQVGVYKPPANIALNDVLDLADNLTEAEQAPLNDAQVNVLRAFPGRGLRVWGARTLSTDPIWLYVNVRRLFITLGRWLKQNMLTFTFEPNNSQLWIRITREVTAYLDALLSAGALKGPSPQQAFYVKCDANTNPAESRALGMVITEIGIAPALPSEFIVVRVVQNASGVTVTTGS